MTEVINGYSFSVFGGCDGAINIFQKYHSSLNLINEFHNVLQVIKGPSDWDLTMFSMREHETKEVLLKEQRNS